jgi:hypothetical protein
VNFNDREDADFVEITKEALALIRCIDPGRYGIIVRHIRYIVNNGLIDGADYNRYLRMCMVGFGGFRLEKGSEHYEWYLAWYAAGLVHEATHGRLHSLWFPYTKATRVRIERICHAEERRFASRITSKAYDFSTLVRPFDEMDWDYHWKAGTIRKLKLIFDTAKLYLL